MQSEPQSSCAPIVCPDSKSRGALPQLAPAIRACNAESANNNGRLRGYVLAHPKVQSLALRGNVRSYHMKFKHLLGLLCAASVSVALAGAASAQDKTVKIGAIFPLSGNAASAGVHAKAAIETAIDIINNAHPELGDLPLAKNAGLA